MILRTLRAIRNKMAGKGLEGTILLEKTIGIYLSSVECVVGKGVAIEAVDESELDTKSAKVVSMADSILDNLEKRSVKWDGVRFNSSVTLCRGLSSVRSININRNPYGM